MNERIIESGNTFELVSNNEIDLEVILQSNVDKYVTFLLTALAVTDGQKKKEFDSLVNFLIDKGETKEKAKEIAHDEIHIKTSYWKAPTKEDKENFPYWRNHSLEHEIEYKHSNYENSVLPDEEIIIRETIRVIAKINNKYSVEILNLINGNLTEQFYETAELIGKIDYLKSLSTPMETSLEAIFVNKANFQKLKLMLRELRVTNEQNVCILSNRKAGIVFAIIDTIKSLKNVLIERSPADKTFTDADLLNRFNQLLHTDWKEISRDSKSYSATKKHAEIFVKENFIL